MSKFFTALASENHETHFPQRRCAKLLKQLGVFLLAQIGVNIAYIDSMRVRPANNTRTCDDRPDHLQKRNTDRADHAGVLG